jgi:hypothetical protein
VLGNSFAQWLERLGMELPELGHGATVGAGQLPLTKVLAVLADHAQRPLPLLDELTDRELVFELPLPGGGLVSRALVFSIKRLEGSDAKGFVASLVEVEHKAAVDPTKVQRLPEPSDPLAVFSLAQLLVDVSDLASRQTHGSIKLQTPREMAYVLGHRHELAIALEEFLVEAAGKEGKQSGPTLMVRERQHRVELNILDLKLGVPAPALKRTLMAPSEPPPGLLNLGRLARAVENSHGTASLRNEQGWGARLTVSLVRARPRLEPERSADIVALPAHRFRPPSS